MKRFFAQSRKDARSGAPRMGTGSLLVLLLAGLLADVAPHDEAYVGLDYALALLALLGAAGLTYKLSRSLDPLPWSVPAAGGLPAPATPAGASGRGEGWPLLVALLLGPFVVLLAGFGGWV